MLRLCRRLRKESRFGYLLWSGSPRCSEGEIPLLVPITFPIKIVENEEKSKYRLLREDFVCCKRVKRNYVIRKLGLPVTLKCK